ncbi:MAG: ribosome silencing factor [Candidatus Adiutricales bacterium]
MEKDTVREKIDLILDAAFDSKATDSVLLKVGPISSVADYFFICSGSSSRQVQAIAENILEEVKKTGGFLPLGVEGKPQGHWILIDYGDVIIHVFYKPVREFYDLEGLWSEAETVRLDRPAAASDI